MNEAKRNACPSPPTCSAVCICGSKRIDRRRNVGWDVWEGGEEDQHEERCLDCGATRFVCDWVEYPEETGTSYGKWYVPNKEVTRDSRVN